MMLGMRVSNSVGQSTESASPWADPSGQPRHKGAEEEEGARLQVREEAIRCLVPGRRLRVGRAVLGSQQDRDLLDVERGAHQIPFAAHLLATTVEEAPESHPCLDLSKGGFRSTFPSTIEFSVPRLVHDPLQCPFGQVPLAHADDLPSIGGFVMATGARRRLRGLVGSRPIGDMLVSKHEDMAVRTGKPVLVTVVAEAV